MSHQTETVTQVDDAIAANVIVGMNELLVALSDDAQLDCEFRYQQQQRLRIAIAHHGQQHKEESAQAAAERLQKLTQGGEIR